MSDTSSDCYTCNFCDLIFNNQEDLDSHNQLHTSSGEFSCPLCKEVFPDLRLLQLHDLRHSLEETEEIKNDPSSVFITFVRPAASFTCNICNEIFSSDEELIDHIAQHQESNLTLHPSIAEPDIVIKEEVLSDIEYTPYEENVYKSPPVKRSFKQTYSFSNSDTDGPNECKTCMKFFNSFGSLRRHQRRFHSTKKTYTCTVCERSFSQLSLLSKHALLHHRTTKEEFECQICKKKFGKSMILLKHIFITHACHDKHFCFACFKFFPNKEQLSHHMQDHIVSETFNCDKCKKRYKTEAKLKKHRCVSIGPRPYLCKVCGKRFLRLHHLERHCAMHKRKRENHKNDLVQNVNKLKMYDCIKCGRQFKTELKLERHRCIYNGPRPYLCKLCGKRFNRLYHLERHFSLHKQGSGDSDSDSFEKQDSLIYPDYDPKEDFQYALPSPRKKFECYICSERYSSFKKYKQHFITFHEGVEFNSCHICAKQFSKSSKVKRHLITHIKGRNRIKPPPPKKRRTSTERLACYQCPKTFANKAGFQRHVLMHEKSKSGNFKCAVCEKKFSEEKLLNEHILAFHDFFTDFQCNLCETKFSSSYHLDQHMLSHSGLKRFKCFKCNTMFTTKVDLKKHMVTHEETKPFPCYFCDKFFTRNYHRQKHLAVCARDKRMRGKC
ncbi:zinc finger protein 26 [Trichonephila inaurata madagascariensis]|uniref:Zinc finger protein 26 n=1 Tax=Trichonephila inaurata madagascariensis TaxID=2747483 RepID=A0A8X6MBP0_9ARAC|nr:zinc finger protein 26 [Trichonephila inaurata madagascariensis]